MRLGNAVLVAIILLPHIGNGQTLAPTTAARRLAPASPARRSAVTAATSTGPAAAVSGAPTNSKAGPAEDVLLVFGSDLPPAPPAVVAQLRQQASELKQERLQKLQAVRFDRRPSAILNAWTADLRKPGDGDAGQPAAGANESPQQSSTAAQPQLVDRKQRSLRQLDGQIQQLQGHVMLGQWAEVRRDLRRLRPDEARQAYAKLLQDLRSRPQDADGVQPQVLMNLIMNGASPDKLMQALSNAGQGPAAQYAEQHVVTPADFFGLIAASPQPLEDEQLTQLSTLFRKLLSDGHTLENLLTRLEDQPPSPTPVMTARKSAHLLLLSGQAVEAGRFLPSLVEALAKDDREALNLLAQHYLEQSNADSTTEHLENAWRATQAVLAVGDVRQEDKDDALRRAVELAPRVRQQLGQAWLEESFTQRVERGREILAAIGSANAASVATRPHDAEFRLRGLELQRTAVRALVSAAPEMAEHWREPLNLLADNWLREAEISRQFDRSSSIGPGLRRDIYGNYYYVGDEDNSGYQPRYYGDSQVRAIATADVLEQRPDELWMHYVQPSLRPQYAAQCARLFLKVNEEEKAFPFIEQLARTQPVLAREMAHEFLNVWTKNHNPNEARDNTNRYMFMYGFDMRAERIPLTRSKQERNLSDLAGWVKRLQSLPLEKELDEQLLAKAFTTSHSAAEVFRLESIENVFGSVDALSPGTLAELIQHMRGNLGSVWRDPATQKENKTRRKKKDIQTEVLQGYAVAQEVTRRALTQHPDDWRLLLAQAAIKHDQNDYQNEISKSTHFSQKRSAALAEFRQAAERYVASAAERSEDDESTLAFEQWLYASLGAVDLRQITPERSADPKQPPLIRDVLLSLPGEAAERHLGKFANSLFTRMSAVSPDLKFRYLKAGFDIVGDHKQAYEARKVFDYYKDLVTEIRLVSHIDGQDVVGHGQPFGVFVDIHHTTEIERESGGFSRYLQNQNNMGYAYNYGRPTENYRDKFRDSVIAALQEQFEVVSVTFQDPEVNSRALPEYGWRVTPYAYLLLKARGPEVDKLPPLRLDLDFLDTSGYVVLPVETPAIPLDARPAQGAPRQFADLQLTQILDERQAEDGKLGLEIKAVTHGLTPELEQLVELNFPGFAIASIEDQDVSVTQFDKESDGNIILAERMWMLSLTAGDSNPPSEFRFAKPKVDVQEAHYQRYVDADLAEVEPTIALQEHYGDSSLRWKQGFALAGALALLLVAAVWIWRVIRRKAPTAESIYHMPEQVTPFTVLGLLRDIHMHNGLSPQRKQELADSIKRIESRYFVPVDQQDGELDLSQIARTWLNRTS